MYVASSNVTPTLQDLKLGDEHIKIKLPHRKYYVSTTKAVQ
jgi:hypothetical protein